MQIEKQVCTIKQAYRLQELGIDGHLSVFSFARYLPDPTGQHEGYTIVMDSDHRLAGVCEQLAPAFTVAELGVMLPHPDNISEIGGWVHLSEFDSSPNEKRPWYLIWEFERKESHERKLIDGDTEAEARADMLIYLLENNIVTATDCNTRLNEN